MRKLLPSDYRDMYEYSCNDRVTSYLLWHPHSDPGQTRRYLEALQGSYRRGEFFDWALELRDSGKMIGTCGYTELFPEHGRAEVGYVLNPAYWGHGYAPEAVMAAAQFAFVELEMNRLEAHFIEGNVRSLRVMEKCGMTFEGMLRQYMLVKGEYKNVGICAITADRFPPGNFYRMERRRGMFGR